MNFEPRVTNVKTFNETCHEYAKLEPGRTDVIESITLDNGLHARRTTFKLKFGNRHIADIHITTNSSGDYAIRRVSVDMMKEYANQFMKKPDARKFSLLVDVAKFRFACE